ncbi:hypothetical protein CupriaWKF_25675 [Cupriavidus sp. WKF15]|uniref:hypothetical protein n=1 Tax=Cupriavidus sp. WKF15 TaxID=3032282 RepID=UPI0023E15B68|nr:hypothetical protein [Cupriavidus sp. WKF15]WER48192.1 hypothetical protein CupriaWKF_25675 [Cupriavidus sp. WKF15]
MAAIRCLFVGACLLPLMLAALKADGRTVRAAAWSGIALLAVLLSLVDLSAYVQARVDGVLFGAACGR